VDALFQETSRYRKTPFIDIWPDLVKPFLSGYPTVWWRGRDLGSARVSRAGEPAIVLPSPSEKSIHLLACRWNVAVTRFAIAAAGRSLQKAGNSRIASRVPKFLPI
jgi:hypothetical protein